MSWALQLVLALVIYAGGLATGIKYHAGVIAQRDLTAANLVKSDQFQQRKFNDAASGRQVATVANLSNQLGAAREKIATLTGRECLDDSTVGVLNGIGAEPGGAPASQPTGTPQAAATDRDVSTAIATCRAWYGEVASQLNQILDIEDRRHPPDKAPAP